MGSRGRRTGPSAFVQLLIAQPVYGDLHWTCFHAERGEFRNTSGCKADIRQINRACWPDVCPLWQSRDRAFGRLPAFSQDLWKDLWVVADLPR
jgi:hypothetical protein